MSLIYIKWIIGTLLVLPIAAEFVEQQLGSQIEFLEQQVGFTYKITSQYRIQTRISVGPLIRTNRILLDIGNNPERSCETLITARVNTPVNVAARALCVNFTGEGKRESAYRVIYERFRIRVKHLEQLFNNPMNNRQKRSNGAFWKPFNAVGDLQHWMWGTTSHSMQKQTDKKLNGLIEKMEKLGDFHQKHELWLNSTLHEMLSLQNFTAWTVNEAVTDLERKLQGELDARTVRDAVHNYLQNLQLEFTSQTIMIDEIMITLTFAREGVISESAIQLNSFRDHIQALEKHIGTDYQIPFLGTAQGWEIVTRIIHTSYYIQDQIIYFELTIPIAEKQNYKITRHITVPQRVEDCRIRY